MNDIIGENLEAFKQQISKSFSFPITEKSLISISKFGDIYIFKYNQAYRKNLKSNSKTEYFNCYHFYNENGTLIHPINSQLVTEIILKENIIICRTEDFKFGVINKKGQIILPFFYEGFKSDVENHYVFTEISKVDCLGNYFVEHDPFFSLLSQKHINKLKIKNITINDSLEKTIVSKIVNGRFNCSDYLFYSDMPRHLWGNLEDQNLEEFKQIRRNRDLNIYKTVYSSNEIKNGIWQEKLLGIDQNSVIVTKKFLKDRKMGYIIDIQINITLLLDLLKNKVIPQCDSLTSLNIEFLKIIIKTPIKNEQKDNSKWIAEIDGDKLNYKKK